MSNRLLLIIPILSILIVLTGCRGAQSSARIEVTTDSLQSLTPLAPRAILVSPTITTTHKPHQAASTATKMLEPTQTETATLLPTNTNTPNPTSTPLPVPSLTPLPPLSGSGGGVIAFFSDRDGNDEIYVMNADGSDQRNLTHHPASDTDPAWSPDGSQIAFTSTRDGNHEIYVMDADGDNIRRLTSHPAIETDPTWSPDSSQIAFLSLRDGNAEIYLIYVDGSNLQRITHNRYGDYEINWSPDSSLLAVASQVSGFANIYTIDIEAALQGSVQMDQLTDTQAHDCFPKWSPDGSKIAFISNRMGEKNWEVYIMDADGGNQKRLTYAEGLDGIPSWSPDGSRIAFESNRDGDNDIYILNVDETLQNPEKAEIFLLTDNAANDQQPAWRPEHRKIEPTQTLDVPQGNAPQINGRLKDDEWREAQVVPLSGGGRLYLMHTDGYLFLGIQGNSENGIGSVCYYQQEEISILHASAGYTTSRYRRETDQWQLQTWFVGNYTMELADSLWQDQHLEDYGWTASRFEDGTPGEYEYQISVPDGQAILAVSYVYGYGEDPFLDYETWPAQNNDDCGRMELATEVTDVSKLQFKPENWVRLILVEDAE